MHLVDEQDLIKRKPKGMHLVATGLIPLTQLLAKLRWDCR
jgi:hypothetical protein